MRAPYRIVALACVIAIALSSLESPAHSQPAKGLKTWDDGGITSNWNIAENWDPDGVPGPMDDVVIGAGGLVFVDIAKITVNGLTNAGTIKSTPNGRDIVFNVLKDVNNTGTIAAAAGDPGQDGGRVVITAFGTINNAGTISGGDGGGPGTNGGDVEETGGKEIRQPGESRGGKGGPGGADGKVKKTAPSIAMGPGSRVSGSDVVFAASDSLVARDLLGSAVVGIGSISIEACPCGIVDLSDNPIGEDVMIGGTIGVSAIAVVLDPGVTIEDITHPDATVTICADSTAPTPAQGQSVFLKCTGEVAPAVSFGMAATLTAKGGFAVSGYRSVPPAFTTEMMLARLDSDGGLTWAQILDTDGASTFGHSVFESDDGGLVLCGYATGPFATPDLNVFLARFGPTGVMEWTRTVLGLGGAPLAADDYGYSMAEALDGGMVVTGTSGSFTPAPAMILFKIMPSGAIDWAWAIGGMTAPMGERGTYVVRTNDGGFAVTGWTQSYAAAGSIRDLLLMRFTAGGTIMWTSRLSFGPMFPLSEGRGLVQTADGGFAVSGTYGSGPGSENILLAKFTPVGTVMWARMLDGGDEDQGFGVTETDDGDLLVTGYSLRTGTGSTDALVARFDAGGTLRWSHRFGGSGGDEGRVVMETDDRRVVVAGSSASYGRGAPSMLLAAFDDPFYGCVPGDELPAFEVSPAVALLATPLFSAVGITAPPVVPAVGAAAFAQTTICEEPAPSARFMKSFTPPGANVLPQGLAPASDGGFVVAGQWSPAEQYLLISRFDRRGEHEWSRALRDESCFITSGRSVVQTSDGGYAVAGSCIAHAGSEHLILSRFDAAGGHVWTRRGTGDTHGGAEAMAESDGGVVVAGTWGAGIWLAKFDASGALQWSTTTTNLPAAMPTAAVRAFDGGFAVAGSAYGGSSSDLFLARFGSDGTLLWIRTVGNSFDAEEGRSVAQTPDGGFLIGGSLLPAAGGWSEIVVSKISAAGNHEWTRRIGSEEEDVCMDLVVSDDGGATLAGGAVTSAGDPGDAFLCRLDACGSSEWTSIFSFPFEIRQETWHAIARNPAGGVLAAGNMGGDDLLLARFAGSGRPCVHRDPGVRNSAHPVTVAAPPVVSNGPIPSPVATTPLVVPLELERTVICPMGIVGVPTPGTRVPLPAGLRLRVSNPALRSLVLHITTPVLSAFSATVYDVTGRALGPRRPLGELGPGTHALTVRAPAVPGVYYVVVSGTGARATAKTVVVR